LGQNHVFFSKRGAGEEWRRTDVPIVKNEILRRCKEERNILRTIKRRNSNWLGHILSRNCHLEHIIEGKIREG
jgi:hypothetical protein